MFQALPQSGFFFHVDEKQHVHTYINKENIQAIKHLFIPLLMVSAGDHSDHNKHPSMMPLLLMFIW